MMNCNSPGERLKLLREQNDLSQTELGARAGLGDTSASRISNYENGSRGMSRKVAEALGLALGVAPSVILYGPKQTKAHWSSLPLVTDEQAVDWPPKELMNEPDGKMVDTDIDTGRDAFFFELKNEHIAQVSDFLPGDLILIDPSAEPLVTDHVLMKNEGKLYLKLVAHPEDRTADNIVGLVVEHRRYKRPRALS